MINQNADFENPKAEIQYEFGETIREPLERRRAGAEVKRLYICIFYIHSGKWQQRIQMLFFKVKKQPENLAATLNYS